MTKWIAAIFAHNEEKNIVSCLESVTTATDRPGIAYVLANGCRDKTLEVVREFSKTHAWVRPVDIEVGDKANAWNVFIHNVCEPAEVCFFVDGDIRAEAGAFDALFNALMENPVANAAAALPVSGRNRAEMLHYIVDLRLIAGNLYALRGSFVARARDSGIRLPVGLIGDDCLLADLIKWDLNPGGEWRDERIAPCRTAKFSYRSLSYWSASDWRLYWRRRIRYSLRHFQNELLLPILKSGGQMPVSVADLYHKSEGRLGSLMPRIGQNILFDYMAIQRIRKSLAAR